jgi:hypothetical protein
MGKIKIRCGFFALGLKPSSKKNNLILFFPSAGEKMGYVAHVTILLDRTGDNFSRLFACKRFVGHAVFSNTRQFRPDIEPTSTES